MILWNATVFCIFLLSLHLNTGPSFHNADGSTQVIFSVTLCNCSLKDLFREAREGHWKTQLLGRPERQSDVLVHPFCGKIGGEVPPENERRFEGDQSRLSGAIVQDVQHQVGRD